MGCIIMKYPVSVHETSWGYVAAAWSVNGLWELSFPMPTAEAAKASLKCKIDGQAGGEALELLGQELQAYFNGKLTQFTTQVDWSGYTPFRTEVLRFTAAIPYGEVRTYSEAAVAAGSPNAARAAGGALHNNRTPIIIPCHRVVGTNGGLVGFGGGLDMKSALLKLEK